MDDLSEPLKQASQTHNGYSMKSSSSEQSAYLPASSPVNNTTDTAEMTPAPPTTDPLLVKPKVKKAKKVKAIPIDPITETSPLLPGDHTPNETSSTILMTPDIPIQSLEGEIILDEPPPAVAPKVRSGTKPKKKKKAKKKAVPVEVVEENAIQIDFSPNVPVSPPVIPPAPLTSSPKSSRANPFKPTSPLPCAQVISPVVSLNTNPFMSQASETKLSSPRSSTSSAAPSLNETSFSGSKAVTRKVSKTNVTSLPTNATSEVVMVTRTQSESVPVSRPVISPPASELSPWHVTPTVLPSEPKPLTQRRVITTEL